ncbi:hypothetical protein Asi02nite_70920 [Asanoa siamensis]|uniref:VOC domain-containing protein n=1 Tax=Asanoa siamensis TaxID=926357 RepID=A0ABQ4D228_9ACTN|nr:hypothetical protein Asi02nite_70920 [Asanoa siamensis]
MHAALDFAVAHPATTDAWRRASNAIVLLTAQDELALTRLRADADSAGFETTAVHEPDLDGSLTAVAFESAAGRLLRHLPLAARGEVRKP